MTVNGHQVFRGAPVAVNTSFTGPRVISGSPPRLRGYLCGFGLRMVRPQTRWPVDPWAASLCPMVGRSDNMFSQRQD